MGELAPAVWVGLLEQRAVVADGENLQVDGCCTVCLSKKLYLQTTVITHDDSESAVVCSLLKSALQSQLIADG